MYAAGEIKTIYKAIKFMLWWYNSNSFIFGNPNYCEMEHFSFDRKKNRSAKCRRERRLKTFLF